MRVTWEDVAFFLLGFAYTVGVLYAAGVIG